MLGQVSIIFFSTELLDICKGMLLRTQAKTQTLETLNKVPDAKLIIQERSFAKDQQSCESEESATGGGWGKTLIKVLLR